MFNYLLGSSNKYKLILDKPIETDYEALFKMIVCE